MGAADEIFMALVEFISAAFMIFGGALPVKDFRRLELKGCSFFSLIHTPSMKSIVNIITMLCIKRGVS